MAASRPVEMLAAEHRVILTIVVVLGVLADALEAAAADHDKSYSMKEAWGASRYAVISCEEPTNCAQNGNKFTKEYLAQPDSKTPPPLKESTSTIQKKE